MRQRIPTFENFLLEYRRLYGNVIKTKNKVYHTGNPLFREEILKNGLVPKIGDSYSMHYDGENIKPIPAVFAVNVSDIKYAYDSTYDDDIWEIDTKKAKAIWYEDVNGPMDAIMTFDKIPKNALKLVYKGTGE